MFKFSQQLSNKLITKLLNQNSKWNLVYLCLKVLSVIGGELQSLHLLSYDCMLALGKTLCFISNSPLHYSVHSFTNSIPVFSHRNRNPEEVSHSQKQQRQVDNPGSHL